MAKRNRDVSSSFIPECQIVYEGGPGSEDISTSCQKNPGHKGFISVSEFKPEDVPPEWRVDNLMNWIKCRCSLTVKVIVKFTSNTRPMEYPFSDNPYPFSQFQGSRRKRRCGTGYIEDIQREPVKEPCPCPECVSSGQPKMQYFNMSVETSTHVICDQSEADRSIFELFYDSEDARDNVQCLYGVWGQTEETDDNERVNGDIGDIRCDTEDINNSDIGTQHNSSTYSPETNLMCIFDRITVPCVTHDEDLVRKLCELHDRITDLEAESNKSLRENQKKGTTGIIISHPHGLCKQITVGHFKHIQILNLSQTFNTKESVDDEENMITLNTTTRCRLPLYPWSTRENENLFSSEQYISNDPHSPVDRPESKNGKQSQISCDLFLTPGTENTLPFVIKALPPGNAGYAVVGPFALEPYWFTFPPGTQFVSDETKENYFFPSETEFCYDGRKLECLIATYNIPTCPGSSGAKILCSSDCTLSMAHEGALIDGTNKSGLFLFSC